MGKNIIIALIRLYQKAVSPLLMPSCRFHPTCSEYAAQAVHVHGAAKGILMAVWRILRCNPLCRGGFDPVQPFPENSHDG
ncbi:MAG TPA: membrane protein insertion efficiency factor YidD [Deltaproteobacteria bacterium]|nr:membrane protein insertion efficiency factor YidD [Deltaproteobacteria bacterium]